MGLADELNRIEYHIREMKIVDERGRSRRRLRNKDIPELTSGGRYVTIGAARYRNCWSKDQNPPRWNEFRRENKKDRSLRECGCGVEVEFRAGEASASSISLWEPTRLAFEGPSSLQQDHFEKRISVYQAAAFETIGYRARNEGMYIMFSDPGRMVGRVTLRDDRTPSSCSFSLVLKCPAGLLNFMGRGARLRARFSATKCGNVPNCSNWPRPY